MGELIKAERILVFELNWLGDILFSFPFLRALRQAYPESYISCVVVPRYADLLINNPWINEVHGLSDSNKITSAREKFAFARMIKKEKYDTCFLLKPSRVKTTMAALSGIPERIGFGGKNAPLTREVELPKGHIHRADQILALAGAVGITKVDGTYEYSVTDDDINKANALLNESGDTGYRMMVINPGGNWDAKRWPKEYYIELSRKIFRRFDNVEIVVTGAPKDIELAGEIVLAIDNARCYSTAGKTGLNELAAIFKNSELVISGDSGPLHLASAVGVTTLGLFGPTDPEITGPRGKKKNIIIKGKVSCDVPCYIDECDKDLECMKSIKVEDVFKAVEKELNKE